MCVCPDTTAIRISGNCDASGLITNFLLNPTKIRFLRPKGTLPTVAGLVKTPSASKTSKQPTGAKKTATSTSTSTSSSSTSNTTSKRPKTPTRLFLKESAAEWELQAAITTSKRNAAVSATKSFVSRIPTEQVDLPPPSRDAAPLELQSQGPTPTRKIPQKKRTPTATKYHKPKAPSESVLALISPPKDIPQGTIDMTQDDPTPDKFSRAPIPPTADDLEVGTSSPLQTLSSTATIERPEDAVDYGDESTVDSVQPHTSNVSDILAMPVYKPIAKKQASTEDSPTSFFQDRSESSDRATHSDSVVTNDVRTSQQPSNASEPTSFDVSTSDDRPVRLATEIDLPSGPVGSPYTLAEPLSFTGRIEMYPFDKPSNGNNL